MITTNTSSAAIGAAVPQHRFSLHTNALPTPPHIIRPNAFKAPAGTCLTAWPCMRWACEAKAGSWHPHVLVTAYALNAASSCCRAALHGWQQHTVGPCTSCSEGVQTPQAAPAAVKGGTKTSGCTNWENKRAFMLWPMGRVCAG